MKTFLACLMLGSTLLNLAAQEIAFEGKSRSASLVELYSSEGCSSCPPAEAWLNKLRNAPGLWKDVFPVAFHVDYWDNLGWPDRFASHAYTQRQREYSSRFGSDTIYTPEFIVNGREWRRSWLGSGSLPSDGAQKSGTLRITVSDKKISATYTGTNLAADQSLTVNVALLGFKLETDVKRGENAGSQLDHEFVVLGFTSSPLSASTDGKSQNASTSLASSTGDKPGAIVAWVSNADGTTLQIAGGWLSPADHISKN